MQAPSLSLVARSSDFETLIEKTKAYIQGAKSPATLSAYRSDFEDFTRFCRAHNLSFFPSSPQHLKPSLTTSPIARAIFARAPSPAVSRPLPRRTNPLDSRIHRRQRITLAEPHQRTESPMDASGSGCRVSLEVWLATPVT